MSAIIGVSDRGRRCSINSLIYIHYIAYVWDGRDWLSKINDCLRRPTLIWPRFLFYFLQSHLVSLLVCQWDSSMAYIQYEQNWPIFIVPNSPFWNIFLFSIFKLWIVLSWDIMLICLKGNVLEISEGDNLLDLSHLPHSKLW